VEKNGGNISSLLSYFHIHAAKRGHYLLRKTFSLLQPIFRGEGGGGSSLNSCGAEIVLVHRDRTRASTLCFILFFFASFEHVKSLLIMGPDNTKNSSLK
jgi:hypothetical protein